MFNYSGRPVRSRRRIPSGFTYISSCVKYTMFLFNFMFWVSGLALMAVRLHDTMKNSFGSGFFPDKTFFPGSESG